MRGQHGLRGLEAERMNTLWEWEGFDFARDALISPEWSAWISDSKNLWQRDLGVVRSMIYGFAWN